MSLFEINDRNMIIWSGTISECNNSYFRSRWEHDLLNKDWEQIIAEINQCNYTNINVFETIAKHRYDEIKAYGLFYNYIYTNRCSLLEIKTINYNIARFEIVGNIHEWTFEEETVFTGICEKYFENVLAVISERKAVLQEKDKREGDNAVKLFAVCAVVCVFLMVLTMSLKYFMLK